MFESIFILFPLNSTFASLGGKFSIDKLVTTAFPFIPSLAMIKSVSALAHNLLLYSPLKISVILTGSLSFCASSAACGFVIKSLSSISGMILFKTERLYLNCSLSLNTALPEALTLTLLFRIKSVISVLSPLIIYLSSPFMNVILYPPDLISGR